MINEFQREYRWLSNFWITPCEYNGVKYKSVEHGYQALKCERQADSEAISAAATPALAKRMTNSARIRKDWPAIKLAYMLELVRSKFASSPALRYKLLATGDEELVEGNMWYDKYWGVDLRTGEGENHLGKILMQVREEIKET